VIMNAPIPLPLLLTTSSLSLETQLYEIITESSKACAAFLRHSLRRKRESFAVSDDDDDDDAVKGETQADAASAGSAIRLLGRRCAEGTSAFPRWSIASLCLSLCELNWFNEEHGVDRGNRWEILPNEYYKNIHIPQHYIG